MKDLVEFPLKHMNMLGYFVQNPNAKTTILLLFCQLSLAFSVIITFLNYFYSNGIDEVTDNIQGNSGWSNILAKLIWCIYYKPSFLNLFEKRKGFWNTKTCSTATKKSISSILNTVSFLQKAFFYQCIFAVIAFLIPLAIVKKTLLFGTFYISDDPLIYFIVWTNNILSVVIGVCLIINLDCLFMGLCYEVIAQFKILYDHLERLDVESINSEEELENVVAKFKFYLEHHKFLLRYIEDIKCCFSNIFLIQYIVTAPSCCTYMYVALESPIFTKKLVNIMVAVDTICEFALYCIPATYMMEETTKIATAIYNSNWHGNHFGKLKKLIQLAIQKAQQESRMTSLGGIVDMNSKSLIMVVRTSFSICTVLRNLKRYK